jgi:hypothetical protein
MILREGPSGPIIEGQEDGDSLIWDAQLQQWFPGEGSALPDGEFVGQPLSWDGTGWVPLPDDESLRVSFIGAPPGLPLLQIRVEHPTEAYAELSAIGTNSRVVINAADGGTIDLFADHPTSGIGFNATGAAGTMIFTVGTGGVPVLTLQRIGADSCVGFCGANAVPRQTITGATEQEQLDSIVNALVAFGLCEDGR